MPFVKGQSGNPAGRPIGARNKVDRDLPRNVINLHGEEVLADGAGDLTREVMAQAKAGTASAMKLCMDRVLPMGRNRPMTITLPGVDTPDYIGAAMTVVLEALAAGDLTVAEANGLVAFVDRTARLLAYRKELLEFPEKAARFNEWFLGTMGVDIVNNKKDTTPPETMASTKPVQPAAAAPAEKINKTTDIAAGAPASASSPALANNNAIASAVPPRAGKPSSTLDRLMSSTSVLSQAAAMGAPKLPATPPASKAA